MASALESGSGDYSGFLPGSLERRPGYGCRDYYDSHSPTDPHEARPDGCDFGFGYDSGFYCDFGNPLRSGYPILLVVYRPIDFGSVLTLFLVVAGTHPINSARSFGLPPE